LPQSLSPQPYYRNAAGQMLKEAWGKAAGSYGGMTTSLYHNKHYNNRQQMYDIRLGTNEADEWTWNRGALRMFYDSNFAYGNGGTNNNGNVYRLDHFVPTNDSASEWAMSLDYYGYDELNRITGIWENKAAHNLGETATGLTQQYVYDRYGNRTVNNAVSNFPGVFNAPFTVDQSNNRLLAPNGTISYNAVGNQVNDGYTGAGARTYDANNKLVSAAGSSGTVSYSYNANGSRVTKTVGSATTWYIYGLGGELVAEYPANGAANTPNIEYGYRGGELLIEGGCDAVRWRVTDHLGSTRMSVGTSGSLASVKRTDYLPFGEEIGAGVGPRTTGQGYSQTDCWRQKFTGYERDAETGLDYAQARMFSGSQGRFTSVDPTLTSAKADNPQTWNRYTYVLNSPLIYADPDGRDVILIIWATADGQVGHAGIAVSNYKTVRERVKENGKWVTKSRKVADGTYTYRDLWPGTTVNKKNATSDVPAFYNNKTVTLNELYAGNPDVTGNEHRNPDGAIMLATDYATDQSVLQSLDGFQRDHPNYNGLKCNCSDFAAQGIQTAAGVRLDADEIVSRDMKATFPSPFTGKK
jgi:RHS repeat-associated protein